MLAILTFAWLLCAVAQAKRNLVATSLVTCMEGSQLSSNSFDVVFDPDDRSLHYTLDLTTQIDSYILAYIDVYAYGFKIITKNFDVCSENWKQFCPVHPGNIEIDSIEYISKDLADEIPGIAYNVPDIDAYAIVNVYDENATQKLACIQVFFSNGKTVSQTGVKWATAVVAGIGLLLSAILSTFGNSTAASHISANTMSLFLYFQSVAVVAMQHVHRVPPIAAAWAENLAWSMGLIRITFMQKIFRWYVQSTGGTPTLYLTATTMSVLTQRTVAWLEPLRKRSENILYGNQNTLIFRGIRRLGYRMNIENTSIVCTGFTFFVLCGYVLAGFIIVCKLCFELSVRNGWVDRNKFAEFRTSWRIILKGALLRYIYIGFTQLTILSFWEFTERDSGAVITIACLFIVLSCGLMLWALYRTHHFASISIQQYNNPAAILYGDQRILHKYGFFYTMFNATHYWWNAVLLTYIFVKSLFIGFAQASGKTQALAVFILDLFYFAAIIYYKPYLDKPTNVVNIFICTVTLVNSFLFMFFSDLFHQNYTVSAVMGWVFFIMNAAFSFLLLMMILAFTLMIVCSKNPDLRFKPANDDRTSFQRNAQQQVDGTMGGDSAAAKELLELGNVAREHNANWEEDLFSSSNEKMPMADGAPDEDPDHGVFRNASLSRSNNFIKRLSSFRISRNLSRTSQPSNPFTDRNMESGEHINNVSNLNSEIDLRSGLNIDGSTTSGTASNPGLNSQTPQNNTSTDLSDPFRDARSSSVL